MRESNVPEKYVKLIQDMYRGCKTKVRSATGESDSFNVDVGLHQGSALSPYLFLILMDALTEGVRREVPESMMFADDIVLCGGREVDMSEYLDTWRKYLEERGMRLSRPKTQFMDFNFEQNQQGNQEPVNILGEELERVTHFKYLGTSMEEEGGMETEITKRVGAGWRNWKKCSGVLCDRRMPVKLKGKVYSIQNSDQASNHREKIDLVRACDEEIWRTHTEESIESGYTREKEERTTKNKMERRVSTRSEKYWTESGRGDGRAMWRRKIISHTGDPT